MIRRCEERDLERFHDSCTPVSAVLEPCFGILGSDCFEGVGDGLIESIRTPGFGCTQELLELGPGLLDGIQIRRVGRQIEKLCVAGLNQLAYPRHLMRRQVVHHHDVARLELGAQNLFHIRAKDLAVDGRGDRHHRFDTAQAHGPQRGQDFPVTLRGGFVNPLAPWRTAPLPRHLRGDATFIQKNQLLRINRMNGFEKLFATPTVGFRVSLGCVKSFFYAPVAYSEVPG
jgi:hypothetical protein